MMKRYIGFRKCVGFLLTAALMLACLTGTASAEKAKISLGGKIGFMYEDASVTLKPKLKGLSAGELKWSSSDEDVAEVSGGVISSKRVGRCVVTVEGGGAKAQCGVVVLPKKVSLSVGETYSLPRGTVESYAVQHSSIARVSDEGVILGVKAGSTLVRVRYGKQTLYVQVEVTQKVQNAVQSAAAELECAQNTDQIVLVEYRGGSKADISIHEKREGVWTQLYSGDAYVGKNGIGKTREGDQKTPSGTYNLSMAFGIKDDPGAKLPYTKVTRYHYWCGTSGSKYYNQLVDMRKVDRQCADSDEYLLSFGTAYNYCMFIDYNAQGEAGRGSCIFLHCKGSAQSTAGCIAVDEDVMKQIVCWAKSGAKIVIR